MFAFLLIRLAEIRDCFSLVSTMIGIFGFGQFVSFLIFFLEKMFSSCFIFVFRGEFFWLFCGGTCVRL